MNESELDIVSSSIEDYKVDKYDYIEQCSITECSEPELILQDGQVEMIGPDGMTYVGELDKDYIDPNEHLYEQSPDDSVQMKKVGLNYLEEYLMCKMEPLYFIETYVKVPVAGGMIKMGDSLQWKSTPKFRLLIKLFHQHDNVLFYSSRQMGKTTNALIYYLWCMIFYPGVSITFVTLDSFRGKDAVARLKSMMAALPKWLQVGQASNAERTTFYYLSNGSKFDTKYVSGSVDPDTVGRGISGSLICLDEGAFLNKVDIMYAALQPSISTAKKYAKQFGYPFGIITVSTPNGSGNNWFYNVLHNSVSFDDIYDYEKKELVENYEDFLNEDEKNAFISLRIHWSEADRDEHWYKDQCKELNFNMRKINQELDLVFLGSESSIFSDDIIANLLAKKALHPMTLPFGNKFKLYIEPDPTRRYILGVDTAMSTGVKSDSSALILTDAYTGEQIGAWKGKFSVVKRFAALVRSSIKGLHQLYGLNEESLTVVIERNSIGKEVVEELIYPPLEDEFEYHLYLYQEKAPGNSDEYVYGFYTSNAGKMGQGKRDQMMNNLMTQVNEHPGLIHDTDLIEELRNLVQKQNGRIEADRGSHDDLILAFCFCLYVRNEWKRTGEIIIDGDSRSAYVIRPDVMVDYLDVCLNDTNTKIMRINSEQDEPEDDYILMVNLNEDEDKKEIRFQNELENFFFMS